VATIRKRGEYQWQAQVRRLGYPPQSKTLPSKTEAEAWARLVESEMDRGVFVSRAEAETTTLYQALDRYAKEVTPRKKGALQELRRIEVWKKHSLALRPLAAIRGSDLAKFRDTRRKEGVADATIRLDLMLISGLFKTARTDWGMAGLTSPTQDMSLPSQSRARERRLQPDEETYLVKGLLEVAPLSPTLPALIGVALETGMRQGELLRLTPADVSLTRRVAHLDDTKSGDPRDVPLSSKATRVLAPLMASNERLFNISQDRLIRAFAQACTKGREIWTQDHNQEAPAGFLEGLKFHDLRHEAASRLAGKLEAQELAKMFGWRTMQMALRYYHPRAEDLAKKLG